jgi:hypothetical protein
VSAKKRLKAAALNAWLQATAAWIKKSEKRKG